MIKKGRLKCRVLDSGCMPRKVRGVVLMNPSTGVVLAMTAVAAAATATVRRLIDAAVICSADATRKRKNPDFRQ
jgi:hypothetical protein